MITIIADHNNDEILIKKDGKEITSFKVTGSVTSMQDFIEKLMESILYDGPENCPHVELVKIDEDNYKTIGEW